MKAKSKKNTSPLTISTNGGGGKEPVGLGVSALGKLDLVEILSRTEGLKAGGQIEHAIILYQDWLKATSSPFRFVALFNMGASLSGLGRKEEAEAAYREAIVIKPDFAEARVNLGLLLEDQGKFEDAIAQWRFVSDSPSVAKAVTPGMVTTALNHIGRRLEMNHEYEPAEEALARSLAVDPRQSGTVQHWVHLRQRQCKWPAYAVLPNVSKCEMLLATSPLAMLAEADDPTRQLLASYSFVQRKLQAAEARLCEGKKYNHKRLRIGYLSSDLCTHAVGMLLPEVFENHDRTRVETFGFCLSKEDGSTLRQRLRAALEHFEIVGHLTDEQIARRILECEIDVLVEMNGLSSGTRVTVLAQRPAPVQVTWLGFIGTTSLPYIDYVLADRFSLPESVTPFFTEKPLYLPHSFLPRDSKRSIGAEPTRAQYHLPEDKFVFASFNNIYKLNPEMFETWLRILQRIPNSVLWLLDDNRWATANLTEFAKNRGVDPARLLFTCRVMPQDHLARLPLADLFLDNHPYNAGSTASDVLWMKVPMLTLSGQTFVSRMGGGLLTALGLPELIAFSHEEYENKAVELAQHPDRVLQLRERLAVAIHSPHVGGAKQFAQSLEDAFFTAAGRAIPPSSPSEASQCKKTLLVRGWRDLSQSYALVNQFQLVELLKDQSWRILHQDMPYASPIWSNPQNGAGFDTQKTQDLASIPPFLGQSVDVVLSLSMPISLYQGEATKVLTFIGADFGLEEKSFAPGSPKPRVFTDGRNWVLTPSNWSRRKLLEAGMLPERVLLVPHGVDTSLFYPLAQEVRGQVRGQVGASANNFVFLNIGTAFWNNGMDLLLRAFAELRREFSHIKLLLKDNRSFYGGTMDALAARLSVEFPGLFTAEVLQSLVVLPTTMTMAQMRNLYGAADLYVSPYRAKEFNLPVLEAMACGCPVLGTKGGATDDFYCPEAGVQIQSELTVPAAGVDAIGDYLEPDFEDLKAKMRAAIEARSIRPDVLSSEVSKFLDQWSWQSATAKLTRSLFGR